MFIRILGNGLSVEFGAGEEVVLLSREPKADWTESGEVISHSYVWMLSKVPALDP